MPVQIEIFFNGKRLHGSVTKVNTVEGWIEVLRREEGRPVIVDGEFAVDRRFGNVGVIATNDRGQ